MIGRGSSTCSRACFLRMAALVALTWIACLGPNSTSQAQDSLPEDGKSHDTNSSSTMSSAGTSAQARQGSGANERPNPLQTGHDEFEILPLPPEALARHPVNKLMQQAREDAPKATLTLEELAAGLAKYEADFVSLRDFRLHTKTMKVEQGVNSKYGHPIEGFEQEIARKGGAWFARANEFYDRKEWITFRSIWRDGVSISEENSYYMISTGIAPRFVRADAYTQLMGVDLLREIPGSEDMAREKSRFSFLDRDFFAKLDQYHVLPAQEEVDGHWCHVVQDADLQTLWIDPARGFVMPLRVYNWPDTKACQRVVRQKDYAELAPGLLIPWTIEDDLYAQPIAIEQAFFNMVTAYTTSKVLETQCTPVDDALFTMPMHDGWEVHDFVQDRKYIVGRDQVEPFHDAIAFSRRASDRSVWKSIGLSLGIIGGLLLSAVFLSKIVTIRREARSELNSAALNRD